ncbi:MAG TPA: MOFRL family protein, partial [Polyangia bacterium]|nr:MOFRL family protein [Polyangia bacterium]
DRFDGSAGAAGAVVDGGTWGRAVAAGLDPQGALERCDSAAVLEALGALVQGPGRSNLLDLHLLAIGP